MIEKVYHVKPSGSDRITDTFSAYSMEVKDSTIIFRGELGQTLRLYNLREVYRVTVV